MIFFTSKGLTSKDDNMNFDDMWSVLSSSLREIHTKNASSLSFEELYRNAYKIVLKKKGHELYENVKKFESDWLSVDVRSRIYDALSPSLLANITGSSQLTTTERRALGERFLKGLKLAWEDHNLCMNMITDVLMYMVSHMHISLPY